MSVNKKLFQGYLITADVRPDKLDLRDRLYQPPLLSLPARVPVDDFSDSIQAYIDADMVRDQGNDGACTGFALKGVIDFLFWGAAIKEHRGRRRLDTVITAETKKGGVVSTAVDEPISHLQSAIESVQRSSVSVSPRMLFHLARFYDDLGGEEGNGSSLRGAMKAWYRHGACSEDFWEWSERFKEPKPGWAIDAATRPLGVYYRVDQSSIVDMQAAINEVGAMAVSAWIHQNWKDLISKEYNQSESRLNLSHANLARINWSARIKREGMHAFALVGYNERGFIVQNSWGKKWGSGGFAILSYEDWCENGVDAWAAVLGVPKEPIDKKKEPQRVFVDSSNDRSRYHGADEGAKLRLDSSFWKRREELGLNQAELQNKKPQKFWSVQETYEHTVVLGSNGRAINRLIEKQNASSAVHHIACELPSIRFNSWHGKKQSAKPKLVIYALSGLATDREELQRMQVLGKCYEENGVYPIFVNWRNGFLDPILDLAGKRVMGMLKTSKESDNVMEMLLGDRDERSLYAWDRTLEGMFEFEGGKPMWTQFKQDALLAAQKQRMHRRIAEGERQDADEQAALQLLATGLKNLKKKWPKLEIHLVGHSGGTIALCHFFAALGREFQRVKIENGTLVKSCTFYAPACSVFLATWRLCHYMHKNKLLDPTTFDVHVLSDHLERADTVGPYHNSFLFLASNALEEWGAIPPSRIATDSSVPLVPSGTPILGMERASSRAQWHPATWDVVNKWSAFREKYRVPDPIVWSIPKVTVAPQTTMSASHDSFPDNVKIANETLQKITGIEKLPAKVTNLNWKALRD